MNSTKRFFRKYLFSSMIILVFFLAANGVILLGIFLTAKKTSGSDILQTSQIAETLSIDSQSNVSAGKKNAKLLRENHAWAMLLNDSGSVIWENYLPEDLPLHYTSQDIARFSRWYLEEYPVLTETLPEGLLVIGYPKNSLIKLNYITDSGSIDTLIRIASFVVFANILLVLLLFWNNTRKVEKAVVPILHGIETIAHGNAVSLPEKGEFYQINTALNQTSQHIFKKDKARAEWINGVSHDIRTPLSVILGYAGEIEDAPDLPAETKEQARIIRNQGEKLRRLITDLNLTAKLEYSMQPLHLDVIYPSELTRQVISEFLNNGLENEYTIEFDSSCDADSITLQGDESLLMRMLGNLIQNSISHNPDGCHITASVKKCGNTCDFIIRDDGTGLSDQQITQFNSGAFSAHGYNEKGETAHGFGLQLVCQIVRAHKGTILFSNTTRGLTVTISFKI